MRIGIVSDSHGDRSALHRAEPLLAGCELLLHAGDHRLDGAFLAERLGIPYIGVAGNTDPDPGPEEEFLELAGHWILLTHGHLYRVKWNLDELRFRARHLGAEIVIFGHTHVCLDHRADGRRFVNPGSLARPRDGGAGTLVIWELGPPLGEPWFRSLAPFQTEPSQTS